MHGRIQKFRVQVKILDLKCCRKNLHVSFSYSVRENPVYLTWGCLRTPDEPPGICHRNEFLLCHKPHTAAALCDTIAGVQSRLQPTSNGLHSTHCNPRNCMEYFSFTDPWGMGMEGWIGLVSWHIAYSLPVKWSPVNGGSNMGKSTG